MRVDSKEQKLIIDLIFVYVFACLGFSTPIVVALYDFDIFGGYYKAVIPAISALLVGYFHKSASKPLNEDASFEIQGQLELQRKYFSHVEKLDKLSLVLAGWAILFAAL